MANELICFDTSALVYGLQSRVENNRGSNIEQELDPETRDLMLRVYSYFDFIIKNRIPILIPPPAIGEFMIPMSKDESSKYVEILNKEFIRVPHVSVSTYIMAASLEQAWMRSNGRDGEIRRMKMNYTDRQRLRVDTVILACAAQQGATKLLTCDVGDFTRLRDAADDNSSVKKISIISPGQLDSVPQQLDMLSRMRRASDADLPEDDEEC
jgi:predicted nucleic acid-binding protein